jgi:hypothetical protein
LTFDDLVEAYVDHTEIIGEIIADVTKADALRAHVRKVCTDLEQMPTAIESVADLRAIILDLRGAL